MDRGLNRRHPGGPSAARLRWAALVGLLAGVGLAVLLAAPAAWLSASLARLTQNRLLLLQPHGTVWRGEATLALAAGPDTPGAMALKGRLQWRVAPSWLTGLGPALQLTLSHPGVLEQDVHVLIASGWHRRVVTLEPTSAGTPVTAQAPAAWLSGLGAPWNTLQPSGRLVLRLESLRWEHGDQASAGLSTALTVQMVNIGSRVTTLPVLGHYELDVRGGPELRVRLSSRPGSSLILEGQGRWTPGSRVEFRGQATAAPGREEALSNLLNIIGRRDGARSIISLAP